MRQIVHVAIFTLVGVSCSEKEYNELTLNCSEDKIEQKIFDENTVHSSLIQSIEDIIYESNHNYNFSINLPDRFDYCGVIPIFFCSVGEPDRYYAIDKTLTEELFISIETNRNDQRQYDQIFRSKNDRIQKPKSRLDIENDKMYERLFISERGLTSYNRLPKTYCENGESESVGFGFNGFSKRGYPHSEYEIYSYKSNTLINVSYRTMGNIDDELVNELFCIMNNIDLTRKN